MRKIYSSPDSDVNSLFLADPPIEALARCGSNVVLRLIQAGYDFEQYRPILTKAVEDGRAKLKESRIFKEQPSVAAKSLFSELPPGDPTNIRLVKSAVGRPSLDPVLMFRVILLGVITNRSDAEMSMAIASDALTRHFVKLSPGAHISRQAIWDYREFFANANVFQEIFMKHVRELTEKDLVSSDGPMILDGSYVEAPRQRNTREENKLIKAGRGDELWNDQPQKKRQKDIDARWTKKNNEVHYGYKIHALVDALHKIIVYAPTTDASVHDSRALGMVLNEEEDRGQVLYADSAYSGKDLEDLVRSFNVEPCFCEKGYKNRPLTEEQKASNRQKSKIRSRVEHVFGHIETAFKGSVVRTIGLIRATAHNWLMAFGYNLCRQEMLCRQME